MHSKKFIFNFILIFLSAYFLVYFLYFIVNPEQKFDPVRTGTVAVAVLGLSGTAQFALAATGTLVKQGFISKSAFPEEVYCLVVQELEILAKATIYDKRRRHCHQTQVFL